MALYQSNGDFLPHVRLSKDLLDFKRYDKRIRPTVDYGTPTKVTFSMSLYQILAIVIIQIILFNFIKNFFLERKNAAFRIKCLGYSKMDGCVFRMGSPQIWHDKHHHTSIRQNMVSFKNFWLKKLIFNF